MVIASAVERFGLLLAVLPLLVVAGSVRRLADRPDGAAVRRGARRALAAGGVAAALLLAWVGAAAVVALSPAAAPRSWLAAALLAGPVLGAALGTLPVLRAAARRGAAPPDRAALAAVATALPARLLPVAAGAGAVVTALAQADVRALGVGALVLVAAVVALDAAQAARRAAGLPPTLRWSPRARLVAPLALVVTASACGVVSAGGSAVPAQLVAGHAHAAAPTGGPTVDVTALTGPPPTGPVRAFTLTADETPVVLASGAVVEAWTFGGTAPGPEIRVRQGDTVEVRLVNRLDTAATTVHWHGVDVPNAMDGVAGVTQDAVPPGGEFTYRFTADRAGTYWYHAHQASSLQVVRGLFGALVVEPHGAAPAGVDEAVLFHTWESDRGELAALGTTDTVGRQRVAPGTPVRLRVVNTDSFNQPVSVTGVPWRLAAIDGTDVVDPGALGAERVAVGGGARADVAFTMPDGPVRLAVGDAATVLSPDGAAPAPEPGAPGPELDVTAYGRPAPTPFGPDSRFDREQEIRIDEGLGFSRGGPDYLYTINGAVFPDVAPSVVREGDLVRVRITNAGLSEHPMHLHGHHVLVLSRDGRPVTGSPVWLDTVLVRPGEVWEVAFRADNPGIWMDHCHVLFHAAGGMVLHLQYEGVTSRFDAGSASGNVSE